jgi:kynurenine 3-monooxygenase
MWVELRGLIWYGRKEGVDEGHPVDAAAQVKPSHHLSPASSASVLLLGDASHSMVPFYGQGLNCGLEDVRVFNSLLQKYDVGNEAVEGERDERLVQALREYSEVRNGDLEAIVQLAMDN